MPVIIRRNIFERTVVPMCLAYLIWKLWTYFPSPLSLGGEALFFIITVFLVLFYLLFIFSYKIELFPDHLRLTTVFKTKTIFKKDIEEFDKTTLGGFKLLNSEGGVILLISGVDQLPVFEEWLSK